MKKSKHFTNIGEGVFTFDSKISPIDFSVKNTSYVVECLFLIKARPTKDCLPYLIAIIKKETSGLCRITLIAIRYEKHPLFGPALDRNEHSTARPKKGSFFFAQLKLFCQLTVFFSIISIQKI